MEPEILARTHLSPAGTRRRASLRAARVGGAIALGYSEGGSHKLVDLKECPVLAPELTAILDLCARCCASRWALCG
jgi:23S rRNA (uracil1939-C5)-methyltransferase